MNNSQFTCRLKNLCKLMRQAAILDMSEQANRQEFSTHFSEAVFSFLYPALSTSNCLRNQQQHLAFTLLAVWLEAMWSKSQDWGKSALLTHPALPQVLRAQLHITPKWTQISIAIKRAGLLLYPQQQSPTDGPDWITGDSWIRSHWPNEKVHLQLGFLGIKTVRIQIAKLL